MAHVEVAEDEQEHKRLDAEELIGLEISTEDFISMICKCVVLDSEADEDEQNLPHSIGAIIVSYLRIQDRNAVKVGDELWVQMDSHRFRSTVGYLQASYPWAFKGRKLQKENDAYLEGLELWERYRVKYDLIDGFGSVLSDDDLKVLKLMMKALPNRAKKHASGDLITLYNVYNLFYSFGVATRDIIGPRAFGEEEFEREWELYGDAVEHLANHLTADEIEEWRPSAEKICHFKQQLLPEIVKALYPPEVPKAKVRKIHLSTDSFRDRTKYLYDVYIGQRAVLFQRVHSD